MAVFFDVVRVEAGGNHGFFALDDAKDELLDVGVDGRGQTVDRTLVVPAFLYVDKLRASLGASSVCRSVFWLLRL
jgi:hypothetical protein